MIRSPLSVSATYYLFLSLLSYSLIKVDWSVLGGVSVKRRYACSVKHQTIRLQQCRIFGNAQYLGTLYSKVSVTKLAITT